MSGQSIVDVVRFYIGSSCDNHVDELAALCARGTDDIDVVKTWLMLPGFSNCGFFALGVWRCVGVKHELLERPYVTGQAISWIVTIAHTLGAVRYPKKDGPPKNGALMHYWVRDGNLTKSHHVEFCLSDPGIDWRAEHAGGGRPRCEIGGGTGQNDIRWNAARPLQCWYDPEALLEVA